MENFLTITIKNKDGKVLLEDIAPLRTFSSGKQGHGAYGKLSDITTGKRYQLSCNIVEIVPKDEGKPITKDAKLIS